MTPGEARRRIDEMVGDLGCVLTADAAKQRETLRKLAGIIRDDLGLPNHAVAFSVAGDLLTDADLPTVIRELRGILLCIKTDHYGDRS